MKSPIRTGTGAASRLKYSPPSRELATPDRRHGGRRQHQARAGFGLQIVQRQAPHALRVNTRRRDKRNAPLRRRVAASHLAAMPVSPAYQPDPQFARLGAEFADPVTAGRFPGDDPALPQRPRGARRSASTRLTDAEWLAHFGRFEPLPGNLPAAAGAALSRPPVPRLQPRDRRRPRLPVRPAARGRDRPAARPRHQGLGPDALVALRRRAADAEGRRARGAGDRDAGGAGRADLASSFSLIETGEALQRDDEPCPTRSAVLVRLSAQPHPLRHASSASPISTAPT